MAGPRIDLTLRRRAMWGTLWAFLTSTLFCGCATAQQPPAPAAAPAYIPPPAQNGYFNGQPQVGAAPPYAVPAGATYAGAPPYAGGPYGAPPYAGPPGGVPPSGVLPPPPGAKVGPPIVVLVVFEGVRATKQDKYPRLGTRVGEPYDPQIVEDDVKKLMKSRKFVDVYPKIQQTPGGVIVIFQIVERPILREIKLVGCQSYLTSTVLGKTDLKVGDGMDPYSIKEARDKIETYYKEKGFPHVRVTVIEGGNPGDTRAVFLIDEGIRQQVLWTKFVGNTIASQARLRTQLQTSRPIVWLINGYFDRKKLDEDIEKLTAYYRALGFFQAKIGREVEFNEKQNWVTITYIVNEGPRFKVRNITFLGNNKFTADKLAADQKLKAGAFFNQAAMTKDLGTLRDLYGGRGYVFADIQADPRFLEEPAQLDLVYNIKEGSRYRVGKINVSVLGDSTHTNFRVVYDRLSLRPGDILDTRKLRDDERRLKASGVFAREPGKAPKLVFGPSAADEAVKSMAEAPGASRRPGWSGGGAGSGGAFGSGGSGSSTDGSGSSGSSGSGGAFGSGGGSGSGSGFGGPSYRGQAPDGPDDQDKQCDVGYFGVPPEAAKGVTNGPDADQSVVPSSLPSDDPACAPFAGPSCDADGNIIDDPAEGSRIEGTNPPQQPSGPIIRGQSPDDEIIIRGQAPVNGGQPVQGTGPDSAPAPAYPPPPAGNYGQPPPVSGYPPTRLAQAQGPYLPQPGYPQGYPPGQPGYTQSQPGYNPPPPGYVQSPAANPPGYPPGYIPPPGSAPPPEYLQPGAPVYDPNHPQVLQLDPSLDITGRVSETQTGKFMVGVGVNSDAGLVGNVVIDEQNFDLLRWPESWNDFSNGTAFRGGGERLRLEASPGTELQRYVISFQEPYLFDTPVSLIDSVSYYNRIYDDWTETRVSGRVGLGYYFTPDLSGNVGVRLERVRISDYTGPDPPPPEVEQVLGWSYLYGISAGFAHDTRDSPFLAGQGHLIKMNFEEVYGKYQYPIETAEARQYYTLAERPDGSGKQVLGIGGVLGITTDNAPIYDNFYAGGFSSLRGFEFHEVSPRAADGVAIGGDFEALGTVEYMFPITADDALRGVIFTDFGTVAPSVELKGSQFRAAPGFGLRITIPALGPAPIALDLAFPVHKADGDVTQVFSFFVGINR